MTDPQTTATDVLARRAVAPVESGMIVGLGTGRAATRGVKALADRVREEGLSVRCVPTSEATEQIARAAGLLVLDFAMVERVDYLFDGADEVDSELRMLKGSRGAMTRERIVAWASDRRVYMVDQSKRVQRLGERVPLAVAVLAFGLASTRAAMRRIGLNGVVRRTMDGQLFLTDNGNLILDCSLENTHEVEDLACALNDMPGVVDHGLFLVEANEVLVETPTGIELLQRDG